MEKLHDLLNDNGDYVIGNEIYDKTGEFVNTVVDELERFAKEYPAMVEEWEKRQEAQLKY